jgi:hypothetical protein
MSEPNWLNVLPNSSVEAFLFPGCSGPEYYSWIPASCVTPNNTACYTYSTPNGAQKMYSVKVDIPGGALFMYRDSTTCDEPYTYDSPDLGGGCYQSSDGWMSWRVFLTPPTLLSSVPSSSIPTNGSSTLPSANTSEENSSHTSAHLNFSELTSGSTGSGSGSAVVIGVLVGLLACAVICTLALGFWTFKLRKSKKIDNERLKEQEELGGRLRES